MNKVMVRHLLEYNEEILLYSPDQLLDRFEWEGFNDRETAKKELGYVLDYLKKLLPEVILYRVVVLDNPEDFTEDETGKHYIASTDNLETIVSLVRDQQFTEGDPYLVTVRVDRKEIDFDETIYNRLMYPGEEEITLIDKASPVILSVEKIRGRHE